MSVDTAARPLLLSLDYAVSRLKAPWFLMSQDGLYPTLLLSISTSVDISVRHPHFFFAGLVSRPIYSCFSTYRDAVFLAALHSTLYFAAASIRLLRIGLAVSILLPKCSCKTRVKDVSFPASFLSTLMFVGVSVQTLHIGLVPLINMPDCPCTTACHDAPHPVHSSQSLPYDAIGLLMCGIVLDLGRNMRPRLRLRCL